MASSGLAILGFVLAVACGGSSPGPSAAGSTTSESRGTACLRDAATVRMIPEDAPTKVSVSHILVRHASLDDPKGATKTREEACLSALEALTALQAGASWSETVDKYSDSGKTTGGDLGRVSRDELSPGFKEAAFALSVNELSYVVESDRGFHVILRTQ